MKLREVLREEFEAVSSLLAAEGYTPKKHDSLILDYAKRFEIRDVLILSRLCGIKATLISEYVRECLLSDTFTDEYVGVTGRFLKEVVGAVKRGDSPMAWDTVLGSGLLPRNKYLAFFRRAKSVTVRRFAAKLYGDIFEMDLAIERETFIGVVEEKGVDPSSVCKMFGGAVIRLDGGECFYANSKISKRLVEGAVVEIICTSVRYPDGSSRNIATDATVFGNASCKRFVQVNYNKNAYALA